MIQDVSGFVYPAALVPCLRVDLFHHGPESHGAITNGELWTVHAPLFQLQQHLTPALDRLTGTILNGEKLLLAPFIYPNDHQCAELLFLSTQTGVNTIRPGMDPLILAERFRTPLCILRSPPLLEARDGAGRESFGILANQYFQCFTHLTRGYPLQIEPG